MRILVIIESSGKCEKIKSILNKLDNHTYIIISSGGHIKNLPKYKLGIDVDNNFMATYENIADRKKHIDKIKKEACKVDKILLGTDNDREGAKIAYDIQCLLSGIVKSKNKKQKNTFGLPTRIIFNEISKDAFKKSIQNQSDINMNVVHAQMARRIIDRLIGYKISPIADKCIQSTNYVSVGRVINSVTKIIIDKELDIENKNIGSKFNVYGKFVTENNIDLNNAKLNKEYNDKTKIIKFLKKISTKDFYIKNLNKKVVNESPSPPYCTATIQQDSYNKFKYSIKKTNCILQQLYQKGYITYIRTDSEIISESIISDINEIIEEKYGSKFIKNRTYGKKKAKHSQDAHECIRPVDVKLLVVDESDEEHKLYKIIWNRTISSQMSDAQYKIYTIDIHIKKVKPYFIEKNKLLLFNGYLILYGKSNEQDHMNIYDTIKENEIIKYEKINGLENYNELPKRYSESTIIKKLKTMGIGRPSTYETSIEKIKNKKYVEKKNIDGVIQKCHNVILDIKHYTKTGDIKEEILNKKYGNEKNKYVPTLLGKKVNKYVQNNFGELFNLGFTSKIEEELDNISNGKSNWIDVIQNVYTILDNNLKIIVISDNIDHKIKIGEFNGNNVYVTKNKNHVNMLYENRILKLKLEDLPSDLNQITFTCDLQKLLEYPKLVGQYKNKDVYVHIGPHGKYIKYNDGNYKLLKCKIKSNKINCDPKVNKVNNNDCDPKVNKVNDNDCDPKVNNVNDNDCDPKVNDNDCDSKVNNELLDNCIKSIESSKFLEINKFKYGKRFIYIMRGKKCNYIKNGKNIIFIDNMINANQLTFKETKELIKRGNKTFKKSL
jgi:DNA topoisomerase-1